MRWFILRVQSKWLKRLRAEIDGSWSPMRKRMTKPRGKKQAVMSEVPLFPSWLFIPLKNDNSWKWNGLPGVHSIVKYGRLGPMILTEGDMDRIRSIEREVESEPILEATVDSFQVGDRVRLRNILHGFCGVVVKKTKEGCLKIELDIGQRVTVNCCLVERIQV